MSTPFWNEIYQTVTTTATQFSNIPTVLSVFNSNIDAVVKVTPNVFQQWLDAFTAGPSGDSPKSISNQTDFLDGFIHCFEKGIAQELLITDELLFKQIHEIVGYDRLQMGGQGGIISNVMSVAGVQNVLVHAASLPKEQASLFLDNENLLSSQANGSLAKARSISRDEDLPLIHWILEFNKGDTISVNDKAFTCPKSNRFIATWDPQNFRLALDPSFVVAVNSYDSPINYCLLSGYQMLTNPLSDGSSPLTRIAESKKVVDQWRNDHPEMIVHFEFASTADITVRKMLFDEMVHWADSVGLNEQELIDLLEVDGNSSLADQCRESLSPAKLVESLIYLFEKNECSRIQLHFFGQYVTIQKRDYPITPEQNLRGMAFAATAAASKAATGAIDTPEALTFAHDMLVQGEAVRAFDEIASWIESTYASSSVRETGIFSSDQFDCIVLPTILVENPVTLVGMGDTISSLSLTGAGL